jgi:hypothetical protein
MSERQATKEKPIVVGEKITLNLPTRSALEKALRGGLGTFSAVHPDIIAYRAEERKIAESLTTWMQQEADIDPSLHGLGVASTDLQHDPEAESYPITFFTSGVLTSGELEQAKSRVIQKCNARLEELGDPVRLPE